jgi:hypothetical protein
LENSNDKNKKNFSEISKTKFKEDSQSIIPNSNQSNFIKNNNNNNNENNDFLIEDSDSYNY